MMKGTTGRGDIQAIMLEALKLALATIERIKPPRPYDSTQGTRDVINAAITKAGGHGR